MSRTPARTALVLCLSATVLATASACRPTISGAAATVGQTRFTDTQLTNVVDQGYQGDIQTQVTKEDFQRQKLTTFVLTQLDEKIASSMGVVVTDQDVAAARSALEEQLGGPAQLTNAALTQGGIGPTELETFLRREAIESKLVPVLLASTPPSETYLMSQFASAVAMTDSADVDIITVSDPALAASIYAQVKADPSKFAALAKADSTDTATASAGGDQGTQSRGYYPPDIDDAIYAAQPGAILGPLTSLSTTDGTTVLYNVVKVVTVKATDYATDRASLLAAAELPSSTYAMGLITAAEKSIQSTEKITINNRYGVWDPTQGSVEAILSDPLSSPAASPSATSGATTQLGGTATDGSTTTDGSAASPTP